METKAPICYMNDKEKIEKAVHLLNELIELAEIKDQEHKATAIASGKAEGAVGESFDMFYLKMVRDLLVD